MTLQPTDAIRAALRGNEPTPEQWRAIIHDPLPLAIVAGAGSGKTAIMAARMVWMTEQAIVRPSQILGLTFTNKAAGELEDRISAAFAQMYPPPQELPSVATYHSFADRLVREHGVRIGIDPDVGLLSEAQRWQLLLGQFDHLPAFEAIDSRSTSSICRMALGLAEQCSNHLVTPERIMQEDRRILGDSERFDDEIIAASRRRIELTRVVRAYIDAKGSASRIDFGDQVTSAVEILERSPELTAELRSRYPAVLLDEYQDTNVAQRRLIQLFAPMGHNVTAVGDARQNIYQWRGSTLFNLIDFPTRHFLRDGGAQHDYLSLSENFRCGRRILSVANRVVEPIPVERRPGNPLRAQPANGDGFVGVKLLADQEGEAAFIAEEIESLHGERTRPDREPVRWSDVAILVRRRSHIAAIYDALKGRGIPVEVVGLGGLLHVPEVLDSVAWLRVLADPGPQGNRWLARILLGPRFRIHYRDLALLARWAAAHTRELADAKKTMAGAQRGQAGVQAAAPDDGRAGQDTAPNAPPPSAAPPTGDRQDSGAGIRVLDETDLEPDDVAYSLCEALDHLDEIDLSPEAGRRLERVRSELVALRTRASAPLLDLVQTVMAETGILEAVDSSSRGDVGAARANITSFLGIVGNFAPVAGDPSLGAFIAYLDAADEVDETLDPAPSAASDSVKLMTVHRAKGLEYEVVFVPGVAARSNEKGERVDSIFPDERTSNPMNSPGQLPYGVREDAQHLPSPWPAEGAEPGALKKRAQFARELRERAVEDERRLFYVALTRAKQRLYVTAAWWYGRQGKQRGPSIFFDEVKAAPETDELPSAPMPAANPLLARLAEHAAWPPSPHRMPADPVLPEGYPAALEMLLGGELASDDLLARLDSTDRSAAEAALEEHRKTIAALAQAGAARSQRPSLPGSLSATQLVALIGGQITTPELARPLPERPSEARRVGTEVHRWIEDQARGLSGLADEDALDAPAAHVEISSLSELKKNFLRMGFGDRRLARLDTGGPMAELPFVLKVANHLVRGRIDAVYEADGGALEIVDFKTGAEAEPPELDQLALYAVALARLGVEARRFKEPLTLTYCYLRTATTSSRTLGAGVVKEVMRSIEERLASWE